MTGYILAAAAAAIMGSAGWAMILSARLDDAKSENTIISGRLLTCAGRLGAVLRDVESDNEIDNLDLRSFVIPDSWLHPGTAGDN